MRQVIISVFLGTVLGVSSHAVFADAAVTDQPRDFHIDRQPLAKALAQFARQANVSVVLPHLSFRDGKSPALYGAKTVPEALARLLRGSEFTFKKLPSGAYRVYRKPPVAPSPAKTDTPFNLRPVMIEEILVSTTRRPDNPQKLPYALSVMSGSALEENGTLFTRDLIGKIPSVSATNQGRGRNKLVIRGMSDGAFSGSTQALVTTYLDYTRLTYNAAEPGLQLVDVEQVEFLRGPQGTLYGSGALGGLYRVVTRKPNLEEVEFAVGAGLSFTAHGGLSHSMDAVANMPLVEDKVAMRLVGYYNHEAGYIDDTRLDLKDVNKARTYGSRARIAFKPWSRLQLSFGVNYQQHTVDDTGYFDGTQDELIRANYLQEPYDDYLLQYVGRVDADFGFADLVSSTSWMTREIDTYLDATLAIPYLTNLTDLTPSQYEEDRLIKSLTHEMHLSSKSGGRFEWLVGLFLSRRDSTEQTSINVPGAAAADPTLGPTDLLYAETLTDHMTEAAGFGELSWFLTQKLSVTLGGRWFGYDIAANSIVDDIGLAPINDAEGDRHLTGFTPKFVISYFADSQSLYYLQGSEGYRIGGLNLKGPTAQSDADSDYDEENETEAEELAEHTLTSFNPDKIFNLELGAKLTRMDGRLQLNGTLFYTWWNQMQTDQFSLGGLPIIGNVGDALNFGAEAEVVYRPTSSWQIRANAGWNHGELTNITPEFGASVGAEVSKSLPGAPSFTGGVELSYQTSLSGNWVAAASLDYSYVGSANLLFSASTSPKADAYHLINARLDFRRGAWLVRLYADNLLGSEANSFAFGNPFSLASINQITPLRPRTVGLEARWSY